jgi:hypothetical protein
MIDLYGPGVTAREVAESSGSVCVASSDCCTDTAYAVRAVHTHAKHTTPECLILPGSCRLEVVWHPVKLGQPSTRPVAPGRVEPVTS